VRVLFKNLLPAGVGGNLFIPVDTTFMGANLPQNRATLHLHGGATPWISDGTPHQWTTPENDAPMNGPSTASVPDMYFAGGSIVPFCTASVTNNCFTPGNPATLPAGATNVPPAGDMTFYWTNQQGGRLMFYHDHSYGITRLNVYAGEAAGYLLVDPAEENALAAATVPGTVTATPDLTHLIPLVIQDKTFVPGKAQLDAQDPTWDGNFGATPLSATGSNGDLWFSHVYMTNQDPSDPGGANGFGRWDYGAWFFPPMTSLTAANPPTAVTIPCTSSAFPGQVLAASAANPLSGCPIIPNPSGTPESFMDTPVVNGKAYPVLHVAPAAYRFQVLSAGNDRSWNLSWFIADATQGNTEVAMLPAAPPANGLPIPLCGAINPVAVPSLTLGLDQGLLDSTGNPLNGTGLVAGCWPNYGPQPGIPAPQTMWAADGRLGGTPDPRNAGPAWIQIGTEGGLLPAPVVIPPTPINYEQNTRSITITSVAVHGLWLGPAERADVIVDFSKFAGKTLILYNDAPTPAPAFDSRLDYFTGDGDQTPIGGAPNTQPGYGPNTRTIMQVVVDGTAPNSVPFSLPALKAAFASTATAPGIFAATQPTTIVPEAAYNSAYNSVFPNTYGPIFANALTFNPIAPLTFESLLTPEPSQCGSTVLPTQCASLNHKAIQELFTLDYGRMNATLGTELPNVNFQNQTTIPLGYVDPPTEIVRQGDTQIWKITHNGVDSHFIHFHLFNVQVINRVGWDGSLRPPDANEMGWKDTVRMNPLEDILVALQPITPQLPWPIPNSIRQPDVMNMNMFTNLDPFSNNGAATVNTPNNFGWEYVWHCHILGHEENDMMRPIVWQVPPPDPSNFVVAAANGGGVAISFTDNSANETGFTIQRDIDAAFTNPVSIAVGPSPTLNAVGEGTDYGSTITVTDTPSVTPGTPLYYRVRAVDDGYKTPFMQSYNVTPPVLSNWVGPVTITPVPIAQISVTALAFGTVPVGNSTTTLANGTPATVVIKNVGTADMTISMTNSGANPLDFTYAACASPITPGQSCSFTVSFAPSNGGPESALLTVSTNDPAHLTIPVTMTGTGIVGTAMTVAAPAITYGQNGAVTVSVAATIGASVPAGSVTLAVDGGAPTSQLLVAGSANFTLTTPTAGSHTLVANYAAQSGFQGSTANGTLVVNPAPLTITAGSGTMFYGGPVPTITPSYSGFVLGQMPATALTTQPTCSTAATSTSNVGSYRSSCSGAVAPNYLITLVNGTVIIGQATSTTVIVSNLPSPAILGQIVTVTYKVTPQFAGSLFGGGVTVKASTNESCTAAATAGACTLTFATGGPRTITATYSGDTNVGASASAPVNQMVSNISLSTFSLLFGNQLVNTTSATQTVTVSNVGTTPITFASIVPTANFQYTSNCNTLAAGRSCRINVSFRPATTGVINGTLTITDSDATSPQVVTLTGTGVQALASLSPASLTFGPIPRRTSSQPQTVTLQNTGTATLTVNNVNFGGTNPARFAQTNNCTTLAPGATCTINVTFSSNGAGTFSAILRVYDNAPGSPQTVAVTGTAQ
jgi:FtsP/CotA-like multicopper oxidase with cupredoxin domain